MKNLVKEILGGRKVSFCLGVTGNMFFQVIEQRRMEATLAKDQESTSKKNFRQNRNVIVVSP